MRFFAVGFFLLTLSVAQAASDCSKAVERAITKQYPYNVETMTMKVKKLGNANIGHRFNSQRSSKVDVYSAGTSDEGGGVLYVVSAYSDSCKVIRLDDVLSDDD